MGREKPDLRAKILDAAWTLLREQGSAGLSQPQVAKAAGVPQGHLTYYFPRKSDLLLAVARRSLEDIMGSLQEFLAQGSWTRADTGMRGRVIALVTHLVMDDKRTRMLLGLLALAEHEPEVRLQLVDGAGLMKGMLCAIFARPPGDPEIELLQATLWGIGLQQLLLRGQRPPAETHAVLARIPGLFGLGEAPPPQPGPDTPRKNVARAKKLPRAPKKKR